MVLSEAMRLTVYVFVATILVFSLFYVAGQESKSKEPKEDELKMRPWLHDYTEDFLGFTKDEYMLIEAALFILRGEGGDKQAGEALAMDRELTKKFNALSLSDKKTSKKAFEFLKKLTHAIEKERTTKISQVKEFSKVVNAMALDPGLCRELSRYLKGTNYKRGIRSITGKYDFNKRRSPVSPLTPRQERIKYKIAEAVLPDPYTTFTRPIYTQVSRITEVLGT